MTETGDRIKVRMVITGYAKALNSADADSLYNAYYSDGLYIPPGFPSMWGPDVVQQKAEEYFKVKTLDIGFDIKDIRIEGQFAFVNAISICDIRLKTAGKKITNKAKDFFVLRKANEEWKILMYMFN